MTPKSKDDSLYNGYSWRNAVANDLEVSTSGTTASGTGASSLLALSIIALSIIALLSSAPQAHAKQTIVALVNDEPISAFDVTQRANLFLANSQQLRTKMRARLKSPKINEEFRSFAMRHNPKSKQEVQRLQKKFVSQIRRDIVRGLKPQARKLAMEELIEERIKLQEAKRLNVVISDEQLSTAMVNMAKRGKLSLKQFTKMMGRMGVDISTMRQRMKASMSWQQTVQRKYGRELSLAHNYLDREVSGSAPVAGSKNNIELQLHKITLPLKGRINQQIMVERFAEADRLRSRFKSCNNVRSLTENVDNAKYQNMGRISPIKFSEPTRSQLTQAKIGEMPPPSLSPEGIILYAVCGKRKVTATAKKKQPEKRRLKKQEFDILAERHLRDLKQDAFIEYR